MRFNNNVDDLENAKLEAERRKSIAETKKYGLSIEDFERKRENLKKKGVYYGKLIGILERAMDLRVNAYKYSKSTNAEYTIKKSVVRDMLNAYTILVRDIIKQYSDESEFQNLDPEKMTGVHLASWSMLTRLDTALGQLIGFVKGKLHELE